MALRSSTLLLVAVCLSLAFALSPSTKKVLAPGRSHSRGHTEALQVAGKTRARLPAALGGTNLDLWNRYKANCLNGGYPDPACAFATRAGLTRNAQEGIWWDNINNLGARAARLWCDQRSGGNKAACDTLYAAIGGAAAFLIRVNALYGDSRNPLARKPNAGGNAFRTGPAPLVWDLLEVHLRADIAGAPLHFSSAAAVHMIYGDIWDDRGYDGSWKDGGCHMASYFDYHLRNSRHPGVLAATVTACMNTQGRPILAYTHACWDNGPLRVMKGWGGAGVAAGLGPLNHELTTAARSANGVLHYTFDSPDGRDYMHFSGVTGGPGAINLVPARVTGTVKTVFPAAMTTHEDLFDVMELAYLRFAALRGNNALATVEEKIEVSAGGQNCNLAGGGVGSISALANQRFHVCLNINKGGANYLLEGIMTDAPYNGLCDDCALWPAGVQNGGAAVALNALPFAAAAADRLHW